MPSICHAWKRRAEVDLPEVGVVALLSLPDLVQAKKTQRDKDWPMIRRLVEVHYLQNRAGPNPRQVRFWLTECRTAPLLIELAKVFPDEFRKLAKKIGLSS
ncbi:MAG: hypothetical protein N3D11_13550 [Candidatus Sumerlaeia bacterium]|nr:hypothetical protein [Candidatus Sumerlaeia bacterium]